MPTGAGIEAVSQSTDLSTGAKAGVAVGVVFAAGLIIGVVTWMCLRRRPLRSEAATSRRSAPIVGGGRRAMTETTSDVASRAGPLRGVAQDYFGPNATAGPYTDMAQAEATSVGTSPGVDRGVPLEPHGPNDITVPVEIDSRASPGKLSPDDARSQGTRSNRSSVVQAQQVPDTIDGRFELYGDDLLPGAPSPNVETPSVPTPAAEYPLPPSPQSPQGYPVPPGHHP